MVTIFSIVFLYLVGSKEKNCLGFSVSSTRQNQERLLRTFRNKPSNFERSSSASSSALQLAAAKSIAAANSKDEVTLDSSQYVPNEKTGKRAKLLRRAVLALTVFALGYVTGGGNAKTATRQILRQPRKFPVLSVVGVVLILKEFYNAIPVWIKRKLPIVGKKQKLEALVSEDPDDMTDIATLALKLKRLFTVAQLKLADEEEVKLAVLPPLMVISQTLRQMKRKNQVSKEFQVVGKEGTTKDIEGFDAAFEYADWAYDEDPSGLPLKELLRAEGYSLLRHDKTALPGYVGHYVALNKAKKIALIGVKGTSTMEDVLTDCCGLAASYELPGPFVEGGKTEIRCHEGILISSKRLADDLETLVEDLLLPTGYKILVVGHSLGAAAASLFAVMMRSRIPSLRRDKAGEKLRVLAFASPPVLDHDNALDCKPFCTTIVNNSDIIPRASLANVIIGLQMLKSTNGKLREKDLDYENNRKALLGKLLAERFNRKDEEVELLMEPEEFLSIADRAMEGVDLRDPEHLYVPGKVVLLCDNDSSTEKKEKKEDQDKECLVVLADDGTTGLLRLIFVDDRMISDHLAPSYRSSLRSAIKPSTEVKALIK